MQKHEYNIMVEWTGNKGSGTLDYRSYSRDHSIFGRKKEGLILGSSDSSFSGDSKRYNPEELMIASISSCHMLWYLRLCSDHQIIVTDYYDEAEGVLDIKSGGKGKITSVTLKPIVTIANKSVEQLAVDMHKKAHEECFIANSCNFPIHFHPVIKVEE
tara:strand:- start:1118 stop:1591 length:474 start_codon:yes stop_codon:yes gene_type:complete